MLKLLGIGVLLLAVYEIFEQNANASETGIPAIPSALPSGPSGATSASCSGGILSWFDIAGNNLGQVLNDDGTAFPSDC
jgi:hypothetical protein